MSRIVDLFNHSSQHCCISACKTQKVEDNIKIEPPSLQYNFGILNLLFRFVRVDLSFAFYCLLKFTDSCLDLLGSGNLFGVMLWFLLSIVAFLLIE